MGLFDFSKKNKQATSPAPTPTVRPESSNSPKVNLTKSKEDLSNVIVKLSKDTGINLEDMTARIAVVMDDSGSMGWQYKNGNVQNILTRLLPFAIQFDDNGELDVYIFSNTCKKIDVGMTEANYITYVDKHISDKHMYGGTAYAPAVGMTDKIYNDSISQKVPTLVFFITDGENSDPAETNIAIRESSKHGIFYVFIGTGHETFSYLRKLDNLEGRKTDNTGFLHVKDLNTISNAELFLESLKDYIPWLKENGYLKK